MTIKPKHDKLFRKALENPIVAQEFFDAHLPPSIKAIVDISSLEIQKESFVEQSLQASISDVLFSIKCNNRNGYLYVLAEHQSTPDHFMAFRLLKYMINIVDRHMLLNPQDKSIPFVFPLVFFNGAQKYNAPLNLWDLFEENERELAKETWTNDYCLVNVQDIPDEEFKKRAWSGIMEFFLKNIREREILKRFDAIAEILPQIARINLGHDYLELMFTYTLTSIDENDKMKLKETLLSHLNKEEGGKLMVSLAEHWYNEGAEKARIQGIEIGKIEGIEKGKIEGKIETAQMMLAAGEPIEKIIGFTKLTKAQILELCVTLH